jgi:hypothetical protein
MSKFLRSCLLTTFFLLPISFAQYRVDPRYQHERVYAVVPSVGKGTAEDPVRPAHLPLRPDGRLDPESGTAAAGVSGVFAAPIPKSLVPPYRQIASETTNLLSVIGHFVEVNVPRIAVGSRATTNLLRLAGRVNPYLAVGLAAVDVVLITKGAADCYGAKKDAEMRRNRNPAVTQ